MFSVLSWVSDIRSFDLHMSLASCPPSTTAEYSNWWSSLSTRVSLHVSVKYNGTTEASRKNNMDSVSFQTGDKINQPMVDPVPEFDGTWWAYYVTVVWGSRSPAAEPVHELAERLLHYHNLSSQSVCPKICFFPKQKVSSDLYRGGKYRGPHFSSPLVDTQVKSNLHPRITTFSVCLTRSCKSTYNEI